MFVYYFPRSFGEVYLAIQKGTFKKYAIKSVKCLGKSSSSRDNGLEAMDMLRNEADLLCGLEHPCIVKVNLIHLNLYFFICDCT